MEIQSFSSLAAPDDRTLVFGGMGLILDGKLLPEDAARLQQEAVLDAELVAEVPDVAREAFDRIRQLHSYGVLWYEAFTLVPDLRWPVLEAALRRRFIEFYADGLPLVNKSGAAIECLQVSNFDEIEERFGSGRKDRKRCKLAVSEVSDSIDMPISLTQLLAWARATALLVGQRNRVLEEDLYRRSRNEAAHGRWPGTNMPNRSARAIRDLCEIINRLWGHDTPDGRLYPSPRHREVLVVGASPPIGATDQRRSRVKMRAHQLAAHAEPEPGWIYTVVLGDVNDDIPWDFDGRRERTNYPTEYLYGPADLASTVAWLDEARPSEDEVTHLDRVFVVHDNAGVAFPTYGPESFRQLVDEQREGTWHLIRADFPADARTHVRHLDENPDCPRDEFGFGACPVTVLETGGWQSVESRLNNAVYAVDDAVT